MGQREYQVTAKVCLLKPYKIKLKEASWLITSIKVKWHEIVELWVRDDGARNILNELLTEDGR